MTNSNLPESTEVLAMRREFDLGFTRTSHAQAVVRQNFLGIRFGSDAYAIRVSDIAGLHVDRRIMPMPSKTRSLLGVVGIRGLIAPVYDLATLLGYSCKTTPRWMVLHRVGEPVALAFENFEAHFSAEPANIFSAPQLVAAMPDSARAHLYDAVRTGDAIRPIIHMQSLLDPIQQPHNQSLRQRSKSS